MNQFIIDSKLLLSTLRSLSPAISNRTILPILSYVKIEVKKDVATITATNTNITIIQDVECRNKESFVFILPFNELKNICSVTSSPLTIQLNDDLNVLVTAGKDKFKLGKSEDIKAFPNIPTFDTDFKVEVNGEFFWALQQALKSTAQGELEVIFNHVCVDFKDAEITVVGTDKWQLFSQSFASENKQIRRCMLSADIIKSVKDFQDAEILMSEKFVCIQQNNTKVIGLLSEQKYAAYETILNYKKEPNCTLNKGDLESSLSKVLVYESQYKFFDTKFTFSENTILLTRIDDNEREVTSNISAEHGIQIESLSLNAKMMQLLLSQLPTTSKDINLSITEENKPIFVTVADEKILCMIMPLAKTN